MRDRYCQRFVGDARLKVFSFWDDQDQDSSVPLMLYDRGDLGSLILIN